MQISTSFSGRVVRHILSSLCLMASLATIAGCAAALPELPMEINLPDTSSDSGVDGTPDVGPVPPRELEFNVLHKANYNPFELDSGRGFKAVQTESMYRRELLRHSIETTRPVDFNTSQVLVSSAGEKPTGGYTISVTKIEEFEDNAIATVVLTVPGASCITTQGITHPFEFVVVPTTKPIEVFERQKVDSC